LLLCGGLRQFVQSKELECPEKLKTWFYIAVGVQINLDFIYKHPFTSTLGAGFFIRRSSLRQVGYFDEEFRNYEDYPLVMKLVSCGYSCVAIDAVLVNYRKHDNSVTATELDQGYKCYHNDVMALDKYIVPKLNFRQKYNFFWELLPVRTICATKHSVPIAVSLFYRLKKCLQTPSYRK